MATERSVRHPDDADIDARGVTEVKGRRCTMPEYRARVRGQPRSHDVLRDRNRVSPMHL
jgi:hypothetical protein